MASYLGKRRPDGPTVGESRDGSVPSPLLPLKKEECEDDPDQCGTFEALKPTVGEAAARMMAEVIPTARDIATKSDVDTVRSDVTREIESVRSDLTREIEVLRGETRTGFAELNGRIHAEGTRTIKWLLGFFVPVWAGTWGTVIAVLMKA